MNKYQHYWTECYKDKGALWLHDGNVKRPHALLTSGKHSNGFFNSELVMEDSELLNRASSDLVALLFESGLKIYEVNRVVGPAMGAITLAHDLARQITLMRGLNVLPPCLRAYTEKEETSTGVRMVFKRTKIWEGEGVLLCEDVLTTGGSVGLTASAVTEAKGEVLPFLAILVNRSGLSDVSGKKIVALIDQPMPMWSADDCPLCKQGSEAIKPKDAKNWMRLNATY